MVRRFLSTLDRTLRHVDTVIDVLEPQLLEFVDDAILLRFPRHSVVVVAMALACKISHVSQTYHATAGAGWLTILRDLLELEVGQFLVAPQDVGGVLVAGLGGCEADDEGDEVGELHGGFVFVCDN
jgi:hypothetical protein